MNQPADEFSITTDHDPDGRTVLRARGRMTPAAGELLYCTIAALQPTAGDRLAADLSGVGQIEPAGWLWLLAALQDCHTTGCPLQIVPPEALPTLPAASAGHPPPARHSPAPGSPAGLATALRSTEVPDRARGAAAGTRDTAAGSRGASADSRGAAAGSRGASADSRGAAAGSRPGSRRR